MNSTTSLMIVEDSQEDCYTIKRILEKHNFRYPVAFIENGDDAIDYFEDVKEGGEKGLPTLILLDLNLPGTDGREILQALKADPVMRAIPIVVTTTSSSPRDIAFCYEQSVQGYFVKPVDYDRLEYSLTNILNYWFNLMVPPYYHTSYSNAS